MAGRAEHAPGRVCGTQTNTPPSTPPHMLPELRPRGMPWRAYRTMRTSTLLHSSLKLVFCREGEAQSAGQTFDHLRPDVSSAAQPPAAVITRRNHSTGSAPEHTNLDMRRITCLAHPVWLRAGRLPVLTGRAHPAHERAVRVAHPPPIGFAANSMVFNNFRGVKCRLKPHNACSCGDAAVRAGRWGTDRHFTLLSGPRPACCAVPKHKRHDPAPPNAPASAEANAASYSGYF